MRPKYRYANLIRVIAILLLLFAQQPTPAVIASPAALTPKFQAPSTVITDCTEAGLEAALAAGGSIAFQCGGPATITLTTGKTIVQDTILDGSNDGSPVVLDGGGTSWFFSIPSGVSFTLRHATLQNGYSTYVYRGDDGYGGAIKNAGSFTADGVTFSKNIAIGGGAIGSSGTLTLLNSTFVENYAYYHSIMSSIHLGAAIASSGGALTIENCTFLRNRADSGEGGAVRSGNPLVTVTDSTFEGNITAGTGGAFLWAPPAGGTMTIQDSHFRSNSTDTWGGALYAIGDPCEGCASTHLSIARSDFSGNISRWEGGALNIDKNITVAADHLTLDGNTSGSNGGGVNISVTGPDESTLTNSVFMNNVANNGGGLAVTGLVRAENLTLSGNKATSRGGGVMLYNNTKLRNSILTGNQVTGGWYAAGGSAIYVDASTPIEISGNEITGNQIVQPYTYGGVIGIWTSSNTKIVNNTIANNTSPSAYAGVIFTVGGGYTLSHNTIVNNQAEAPSLKNYYSETPQNIQGNILVNLTSEECVGSTLNNGSNYISDSSCGAGPNDVIGDAPRLGALTNNGGLTKTFNLYADSPALDAAASATCPDTDQRGVSRPVGSACDIGALEADSPLPLPPPPPPLPVLTHLSFTSSPMPSTETSARNEMTYRGDPVNTIFGNFTYQHTDLRMPGVLPFNMDRSYNSAVLMDGPLGFGWTVPFDQRLSQPAQDQLVVRRSDGRQDYYTVNGDEIIPPAGSRDVLRKLPEGGYSLTTRQFIVYRFNSDGRLASAADPNGNTITFTYTGSQVTAIQDATGRSWTLAYDAPSSRLTSLKDPAGREVKYGYDTFGNLTEVTNPEGGVTHYQYDNLHHLTKITDPDGKLIAAMDYDLDGRVVSQTDARGMHKYVYTPGQTLYTNPTGLVTAIKYDDQYRATENITAAGTPEAITTQMSYGTDGFIASQMDGRGNTTLYQHDLDGNITQIKDGLNLITQMTYDERGNLLTRTDPLNHTTTYTYNAANRLLTVTDPAGAVTTNIYDPRGLLISQTDALDQTTQYSYDDFGNLLTITDALNGQVKYTYDAAGRVTEVTDALGKITTYTYNALDQVLTKTAPDGGITTHTYSPNGSLLTSQDPLGHLTTFTYTLANDLESTQDALGRKTIYTYDAMGHRLTEQRPDGTIWINTYDAFGRLVSRTSPLGLKTRYTYDANGNILSAADPAGSALTYTYDALNRMTGVKDALGGQTSYAYDGDGRLVSITDPLNHTTTYAYDALGRRTSETDALNHSTIFIYDALGRMTERQNASGQKVTYTYDALNHLLSISGAGVDASFTYDAAGRRASMSDSLGKTDYAYDAVGRLATVSGPQGSVTYTYDLAGNRTAMTQPGASLAYAYDALNRLASLSLGNAPLASYTYNTNGLNDHQTLGSGAATDLTYDEDARLASMQTTLGNAPLLSVAYSFNERGDRAGETTQIQGAEAFSAVYSYDASGRLVTASLKVPAQNPTDPMPYRLYLPYLVQSSAGARSAALPAAGAAGMQTLTYAYTYDAAGNRLNAKESNTDHTNTYNAADQISSSGYVYDAAGRLSSDGTQTYTYDALNRITSISGKVTASYLYDGDGNRVGETVGGVTTRYLLDTNLSLPVRIAAVQDGKTTRSFFGLSLVAEQLPDGTLQYLHADGLGNIRLVTGKDGKILGHAAYQPFGAVAEGKLPSAFGFTGEPGSAGLIHLRARDYSPALGRFLTPDLASALRFEPQTIHRYAYTRNSPVNRTDPSGMRDWQEAQGSQPAQINSPLVESSTSKESGFNNALSGVQYDSHGRVCTAEDITCDGTNTQPVVYSGSSTGTQYDSHGRVCTAEDINCDGTNTEAISYNYSTPNNAAGYQGQQTSLTQNLVSTQQGNVIAFGGGNVIAMGGGNVIAMGGGNVIAFGGGNVIAFGGGN